MKNNNVLKQCNKKINLKIMENQNIISKIAIGKNIDGEEIEFTFNNLVDCSNKKLTELHLPNGVIGVYCFNNKLTELHLPNGVEEVYCFNNNLTELHLPNSVKEVWCWNNPIKEITLPKSIILAYLPLNCKVLNLDEFINNKNVKIIFV